MPSLSFRFLPFFALHFSLFTLHYLLPLSPSSPCFTRLGSHHFCPAFRLLALSHRPLFSLLFSALGSPLLLRGTRFSRFFRKTLHFCPLRAKKRADGRYCVYSRQKPCRPSHAMPDRNARRIFCRTAAMGIDRTWQVCYTDGKARQDRSGGHRVADPLPRCARHTEAYTGPLVGQGRPSTDQGSKRDALL